MTAEAAITSVVNLLEDELRHTMIFQEGVEDQIRFLKEEMKRVQSFLRDANKRQDQNYRIHNWISDVGEVALDAEDAIEMFFLNHEKSRELNGHAEAVLFLPTYLLNLHRFEEDIKSFVTRFEELRMFPYRYGIRGEPIGGSRVEARRRSVALWEKDEHLVGVEDDVKKLLQSIMDEEKKDLSMVAVVGKGGIGKSTLALEVYNHPDVVSGRFDCRAWVVFSSEYTPLEMMKHLILETTRSEQEKQVMLDEIKKFEVDSMRSKLYLERKLKELLQRRLEVKTYFIVLDDVWEKEHLDSFITAFPNGQDKTCRILLTTRNKHIANQCQSFHEMKVLDNKKSWELFLKKCLTSNSNGEYPKELEQIGRYIVDKCEGLPLSIIVMGGLMAETKSNMVSVKEALNELNFHLKRAGSNVSAILELSYQNLSAQLKSIFLCLAFFKEDATIPVKKLLSIMVGQGLIRQTQQLRAEEIARGYLDELINRNMVHIKDLTFDNRVKSCHMHDSLREICLKKAKEEICLKILKRDSGIFLCKPRHCIVKCDDLESFPMKKYKHIRSLFVIDVGEDIMKIKSSYWKSFQHLKILDLDCDFPLRRLPNSFRSLLELKQLSVRRQKNKIFFSDIFNASSRPLKLPAWLNTLKKLELLDLGIELVEFPNVALKMYSLRYLRAYCVHGCGPMITDSWKNIETLKYIRQEDWMRSNLSLKGAYKVQELGIIMVDESSKVSASLQKLENLVKLYLVWNYLLPIEAAIDIPHLENLTKLKLNGMMRECPNASMLPPSLSHLTLENSFLHEDPMQELGKLPNLLYLKLKDHSYMGERMQVLHDGFPRLKGRHIREMYELRKVVIKEGGMPQLKLLQVRDCHALDTKNLSDKSYKLQILDTI